jgi:glyoxylase-like metal-dependent hydrolase (beta-lactamase superfamily II)
MQTKDFEITQLNTACLSQFGYFIKSGDECAIIDPIRDIDVLQELIIKSNCQLKYIILTHFHADFVAGHFELQRKTGAQILMGPSSYTDKVNSN